jgi:hypothetical protein
MRMVGPSSEEEMIAAFLKAEIDSPRFQNQFILPKLGMDGRDRRIVDAPNLLDSEENNYRAELLQGRGYVSRSHSFAGFPRDVIWSKVLLEEADFRSIKYGNWPAWVKFSNGTRWTWQAAENFRLGRICGETLQDIFGTIRRLVAGERLPPLILVAESASAPHLVLLEGHVRATSFLLAGGPPLDAILGYSKNMDQWAPF